MDSIVYHILNILLSCILTFVVTFVGTKIIKDKKAQTIYNNDLKNLCLSLTAITLYKLFSECLRLGYRTSSDTIAFKNLSNPYYAMGGDGYIHDIEVQFYKLSLKDSYEESK